MFAERLKMLRKEHGITQVQFAQEFNISQGTIGMWETGKREPDFATTLRIANFFHVSISYLLGQDNEKRPAPKEGDGLNPLDRRLNELLAQATDVTKQAMIVLLEQSQKH